VTVPARSSENIYLWTCCPNHTSHALLARCGAKVVSDAGWSRYAVVLVDLQYDFWPDDVASNAPELPTRVANLLEYARTNDLTVVHVRARFDADGGNWMARYRLLGAETLPFAKEIAGEPVIIKHTFDGFLKTELHDVLTVRGIQGLMIGGLVTSTCVLFTATTATQLGYLVSVLSDCCSDSEPAHSATLNAYRYIFDSVPSTEVAYRRTQWDTQLKTMHPGG
jgi:nicotinamidase-related amidase